MLDPYTDQTPVTSILIHFRFCLVQSISKVIWHRTPYLREERLCVPIYPFRPISTSEHPTWDQGGATRFTALPTHICHASRAPSRWARRRRRISLTFGTGQAASGTDRPEQIPHLEISSSSDIRLLTERLLLILITATRFLRHPSPCATNAAVLNDRFSLKTPQSTRAPHSKSPPWRSLHRPLATF